MDTPALRPAYFLGHLRAELGAFLGCLDADLDTPVVHCGDWTLYDLADHVAGGSLWTVAAVTERHGGLRPPPAPRERDALKRWVAETSDTLAETLDTDPGAEAWTFWPPHTVAFWQRRRCHEAVVHRWDAQNALGDPGPIDAELAADGVAEVFDTMLPRQVKRGTATVPEHGIVVRATDTGGSWSHGTGEPAATVSGRAQDLVLALWKRLPAASPALAWEGDAAAGHAVFAQGLTP